MFKKPKRKVERVFVHCTAYPHQDLKGKKLLNAVNAWHKARWPNDKDKNGLCVGYTFLIDCDGKLIPARDPESTPVAQAGHNSRTLAICLDGLHKYQFNEKQFKTLNDLADEIDRAYNNEITWHGHCEVSAKACPVFDYKKVLNLDSNGYRKAPSEIDPGIQQEHLPGSRTLSLTSSGTDVAYLQKFLKIESDGAFGQETYNAVIKFQKSHDLVTDGIVGPITWKAIFYELIK